MTLSKLMEWGLQTLRTPELTEEETWYEVRLLLEAAFHLTTTEYLLQKDEEASPEEEACFRDLVARRKKDEPIAYILGEWEFMGLPFKVDSSTLIPRQDTELLVETALASVCEEHTPLRILDLCCGSGCIAVSLAVFLKNKDPQRNIVVVGCDLSKEAVRVSEENAKNNGCVVDFRCADLWNAVDANECFDLIVSNPPYISKAEMETLPADVKAYEPESALYGGEDGLDFYRRIIPEATRHLVPDGQLMVEIGDTQARAVSELFREAGFYNVKVVKDLPGHDRVVKGTY